MEPTCNHVSQLEEFAKQICFRCRNGEKLEPSENRWYHKYKQPSSVDNRIYLHYDECAATQARNFSMFMERKKLNERV